MCSQVFRRAKHEGAQERPKCVQKLKSFSSRGANAIFLHGMQKTGVFQFYGQRSRSLGKNPATKIGIETATFLKLRNPEKYTGHCWRVTACTLLAEEGQTLAQIKNASGHISDAACMGYIAVSKRSKEETTRAITLQPVKRGASSSTVIPLPLSSAKRQKSGSKIQYNITVNTSDTAKCTILIGAKDNSDQDDTNSEGSDSDNN